MIFDTEATLLARLAAKCAPGSVLQGTFDPVDMTDDSSTPVIGQLVLSQINATSQTGTNCRALIGYEFGVYVDIARASSQQKTDAAKLLEDAINAMVGWEFSPGREVQISDGRETGFDGRILRLSFGFYIPAHFVGS
jgi:hypothetical protein